MDNEAPKYASWMPESGGYVANGNVVSKSPLYDEAGKLRLQVDTSVFGNTQPTSQPSQNTQVANQPTTNVGITTANTSGSSEDVNAPITGAGSMATLEENTATTGSAINTPATYSPVAGETTVTELDKINKEYQDAVARGDYQGQINALIEKQRQTGQDYSTMIDQLTRARVDKIANQDALYQEAINNALDNGDTQLARQLMQQQADYRNTVGYDDAMAQKQQYEVEAQKTQYEKDMEAIDEAYNQKMQEFQINYDTSYQQAVKDIGNSLVQMLPGILNFQYDPMQDTALQVAQGYAVSKVKEQMNATGMYYSSMTQSAITKAIGELVPVYQKMARQEAIENFQLLQNTASFLMDLETSQFNLWKGQIQMQWAANDEKRKAISSAIEASNARGYINNEEAAILGVAPGTESYEARKEAQARQAEIEKERRKLQQDIIMADFNNSLAIEKAIEQAKIDDWKNEQQAQRTLDRDWWNYQYDMDKIEANFQNTMARDAQQYKYDINKLAQQYSFMDRNNANQYTRDINKLITEYGLKAQLENAKGTTFKNLPSDMNLNFNNFASAYDKYSGIEDKSNEDRLNLLDDLKLATPKLKGTQELLNLDTNGQFTDQNARQTLADLGLTREQQDAALVEASLIKLQEQDRDSILKDMTNREIINPIILANAKDFSSDKEKTQGLIDDTIVDIQEYINDLKTKNVDYTDAAEVMYASLVNSIWNNSNIDQSTKKEYIRNIMGDLQGSNDTVFSTTVAESVGNYAASKGINYAKTPAEITSDQVRDTVLGAGTFLGETLLGGPAYALGSFATRKIFGNNTK